MKSILWGRKAKIGENVVFVVLFINNKKKHSLSFFSIESLFFFMYKQRKNHQQKKKKEKKKNHIRCTGKSKLVLLFNRFIISYSLCKRKQNFSKTEKNGNLPLMLIFSQPHLLKFFFSKFVLYYIFFCFLFYDL